MSHSAHLRFNLYLNKVIYYSIQFVQKVYCSNLSKEKTCMVNVSATWLMLIRHVFWLRIFAYWCLWITMATTTKTTSTSAKCVLKISHSNVIFIFVSKTARGQGDHCLKKYLRLVAPEQICFEYDRCLLENLHKNVYSRWRASRNNKFWKKALQPLLLWDLKWSFKSKCWHTMSMLSVWRLEEREDSGEKIMKIPAFFFFCHVQSTFSHLIVLFISTHIHDQIFHHIKWSIFIVLH